jgi:hypothetical protein
MRNYYTLFVLDTDTETWHNEFGAYTQKECKEEIYHSFPYTKKKHTYIHFGDGTKEEIQKVSKELNS